MKLHWMPVHESDDLKNLSLISQTADECYYSSILLVYHSLTNDFWIKCANAINLQHTFKYLLAIRTYAISPEYFVMMYKAFNEIQKNRIMFNIVAGDVQDSESCINNLVLYNKDFDTVEKRVNYTYLWMKKMLSLLPTEHVPEIVMSGTSGQTLLSAALFADYNLSMLDTYESDPTKFSCNKNKMVCCAIVIRNTYEEAEHIVNNIDQPHQKRWTIFGTEEQIVKKIKELKKIGVTDLMLRSHKNDDQFNLVHDFVKNHKGVID